MGVSSYSILPHDGVQLFLGSGMLTCLGVIGVVACPPATLVAVSAIAVGAGLKGMHMGWKAGTEEIDIKEVAPELLISGSKAALIFALRERITKDLPKLEETVILSISTTACDIILKGLIKGQLPTAREVINENIASIYGTFSASKLCEFIGLGVAQDDQLGAIVGKSIVEGGMRGFIEQSLKNRLNIKYGLEDIDKAVILASIQEVMIGVLSKCCQQKPTLGKG
jgi:hypothetical protein